MQANRAPAGPPGGGGRPEPGNTERVVTTDQALRLPVDASDPNALAALTPGVVQQRGSDSTAAGFNVAGQRATQNNTTLDGVTFGGAGFPQEAVRSTRVITNTFDVARGQFSGGQVASTTRSGTNNLYVGSSYSLRDPRLQWRPDYSGAFGQGYTQNSLSGGVGGAFVKNKAFYFVSGSLSRRSNPLQSLLGADPAALRLVGANPDSVDRFLGQLRALGVSSTRTGIPGSQLNDNVSGIARFDLNLNDEHTLSLRGDYRTSEQDATRIGALSVPTFGGDSRTQGGGVMLTLTSRLDREIFGGTVINEAKVYATGEQRKAAPYLLLPASRVRVTSDLGEGTSAVSTLSFGGNPTLNNDDQTDYVESTEEVSWQSPGGGHRVKLGGLLNASRYDQRTAFNPYGTYTYNSLQDFLEQRPALFTRSLAARTNEGGAVNAAGYLGDTWRRSRSFQLTYGARLEGSTFSGAPALNPAVQERFGLRTDRFPSEVRVSPRVGFSYTFFPDTARQNARGNAARADRRAQQGQAAPFGRGGPTLFVRGGIGEFRGRAPSSLFSAAQQGSGLAGAETQLVCAGAAVPIANYAAYATQGIGAIPTQCLPVTGGTIPGQPTNGFQQATPAVTAIADGFRAPRTYRANLGVTHRFWERYTASLDASYTLGQAQYAVRDLNLDTSAPEFTLGAEGNRPVWVPTTAIVPTTGVSALAASRVDPRFAQVFEVTSRYRSRNVQATAAVNGFTSKGVNFNLSWTLARSRDQSSFGFGGPAGGFSQTPTAGNPNTLAFAASDQDTRHNLIGTITYPLGPSFEVTAIGRATSGQPYTPIVQSDINGDGARNDAAFVFDPATLGNDPTLQAGMQRLLATAPASARECLESQIGRVAGRNSCRGPWTPGLDLQLNYKPDRLGLKRRLTISGLLVNPLAGLDQALHGDDLRGWGQFTRPDPTLLAVRGFDAATRRYVYEVNNRFGNTRQASQAFRQTFQVGLQARYVYGQGGGFAGFGGGQGGGGAGRGAGGGGPAGGIAALLGGGANGEAAAAAAAANPVAQIIDLRDSLVLDSAQVTKLEPVRDSLAARNTRWATEVRALIAKQGNNPDQATLFSAIRPKLGERGQILQQALRDVQTILTPEQWTKVPENVKNPFRQFFGGQGGGQGDGGRRPPND